MRTFVAIPIPESVKEYLGNIQIQFKKCNVPAKWVNIQNIHITLKFLGEVKEYTIEPVKDAIKEIADKLSPIKIDLINFGFFPNERNPRVFFTETSKEEILQKAAYDLEEKLEPLGFAPEHKFKSHITLARLKGKTNIHCLTAKSKEIKLDKSFYIKSIILYKSILTPKGPIYEKIFTAACSS